MKPVVALVFVLSLPCSMRAAAVDTVAPGGRWVSPGVNSLVTTNTIRVSVDAADNSGGSGIEKVVFYAAYLDNTRERTDKFHIGTCTAPPWELLWDCSAIPDQFYTNLHLYCEIVDRAGNVQTMPEGSRPGPWRPGRYNFVILDRNPRLRDQTMRAPRRWRRVRIDGKLDEWRGPEQAVFYNNDNRIAVRCAWDRTWLYMAIDMRDRSVVAGGGRGRDLIEVYIDPDHNHGMRMDAADAFFVLPAVGALRHDVFDSLERMRDIETGAEMAVTVHGSANEPFDDDTGFVVECALPWDEIGVRPSGSTTIGFDLLSEDWDFPNGGRSISTWSGAVAGNVANASEWGNLVLDPVLDRRTTTVLVLVLMGILALIGWTFIRGHMMGKRAGKNGETTRLEIARAQNYISRNFHCPELSLEEVAGEVGLSKAYFSTIFAAQVGEGFVRYLTRLRVNRAVELLRTSERSISQIASDTGFADPAYFSRSFKRTTGKAPSEYRPESH